MSRPNLSKLVDLSAAFSAVAPLVMQRQQAAAAVMEALAHYDGLPRLYVLIPGLKEAVNDYLDADFALQKIHEQRSQTK